MDDATHLILTLVALCLLLLWLWIEALVDRFQARRVQGRRGFPVIAPKIPSDRHKNKG
jgi:hypothetical protein